MEEKAIKVATIAHIGADKTGLVAALDLMMSNQSEVHIIAIKYQKPAPIPSLITVEPFRGKVRKRRGRS